MGIYAYPIKYDAEKRGLPPLFRVFGGFFTRKSALIDKAEELTFKNLQKFLAQIQKKFQDPYMRGIVNFL